MQIHPKFLKDLSTAHAKIPVSRLDLSHMHELIHNAYDANASSVNITLQDFSNDYQAQANSKIIVEEDGDGIDLKMLENWFVYGKSAKSRIDAGQQQRISSQNRVLMGGLGFGRQATLIIGHKVKIFTKTKQNQDIHILEYVFSNGHIEASLVCDVSPPNEQKHGTRIEISDIIFKKHYSKQKILKFCDNKLTEQCYLFSNETSFKVSLYKDTHCINSVVYRGKNKYWMRLIIMMRRVKQIKSVRKVLIPLKHLLIKPKINSTDF